MASEETTIRLQVTETARALADKGLNRGAAGNVSARADGGFFITPSGVPYDALRAEQIVFVDFEGKWSGPLKPSSEWRMHRDIYTSREEAGAVVHTHSDNATALACLNEPIPAFHYMVAAAGGTLIDCAPYATFGTKELSENMLRALGPRRAALLAHHGMICYGRDLPHALYLAEEVEGLARQYILARSIGAPKPLPEDEMARVLEMFRSYGQ
jgi:L-fuculose-phosphate aldolase